MQTQHQIKRRLSEPGSIERVQDMVANGRFGTRTALAKAVCEQFGFRDRRGRLQEVSCQLALRALDGQGRLRLPAATRRRGRRQPIRRLGSPIPAAQEVPAEVGSVRGLELVEVTDDAGRRQWNELMLGEHPLGAGPLVGRQLRYLVCSEHGVLGGIGFGAAALKLSDRDRWIGWDGEGRRQYLDLVVCMNRFLIRPGVQCANLASAVLGQVLRQLPEDFHRRYGYRPLLVETFVDPSAGHTGSCFRAANFVRVGQTQGRGRQDRHTRRERTKKDIYVYALRDDFRQALGLPPSRVVPLAVGAGLDQEQWAAQEFGGAELGDRRLSRRLVTMAAGKGASPAASWTRIAAGDPMTVKATYRFLSQPDDSPLTMAAILAPHQRQTVRRMAGQRTVLCVHDTTDLNYASLNSCRGLGIVGTNQTTTQSRGLRLHSTLAISGEGLPLGVLRTFCYAPELKPERTRSERWRLPIEEKDSFRWIESFRYCQEVAAELSDVCLINIMDREGDQFAIFDQWRRQPRGGHLLVRAMHDRRTEEGASLFASVEAAPVMATVPVQVPAASAQPKKGKKPARPRRPARRAEVLLRVVKVTIEPPWYGPQSDRPPIALTLVHIVEPNPPPGEEPLQWSLLTTLTVTTKEDAQQCLRWYTLRWRIEDWHRVVKSGCGCEQATHRTGVRLQRVIAIDLVVAWRIMLMTLLGRQVPGLPPDLLFTELELDVLESYSKKTTCRRPRRLPPP
jgi:hypothetical protein